VTIGDSVTAIGSKAFRECALLTSVTIGNSVTAIGDGAFRLTKLTSVTIGDSVTAIGEYAFTSCRSLTRVTIGDSVTAIGQNAFTSITIPDSVMAISGPALAVCCVAIRGWCFSSAACSGASAYGFIRLAFEAPSAAAKPSVLLSAVAGRRSMLLLPRRRLRPTLLPRTPAAIGTMVPVASVDAAAHASPAATAAPTAPRARTSPSAVAAVASLDAAAHAAPAAPDALALRRAYPPPSAAAVQHQSMLRHAPCLLRLTLSRHRSARSHATIGSGGAPLDAAAHAPPGCA
jgi:hypothetical protein